MKEYEKNALIKGIYKNLSNKGDYEIIVNNWPITNCWIGEDGGVWIEIAGENRPLSDFSVKVLDEIYNQSIYV